MTAHLTPADVLALPVARQVQLCAWWQPRPGDCFYDLALATMGIVCAAEIRPFAAFLPQRHAGLHGGYVFDELVPATTRVTMLPLLSIGQLYGLLADLGCQPLPAPNSAATLCDTLWAAAHQRLRTIAPSATVHGLLVAREGVAQRQAAVAVRAHVVEQRVQALAYRGWSRNLQKRIRGSVRVVPPTEAHRR